MRARKAPAPRRSSLRSPTRGTCSASTPGSDDARNGGATPLATAKDILPPSGAGETGFDSTGAIGKKKKAKKKPGEPRPLPPPPPPLPGAPQAAGGHTSAQQIKARAPYADAYKPPDAPPRRPAPLPQDAFEPLGVRVGSLSAEALDRGHARLRHQSVAQPERQGLGLHGGRAHAQDAIAMGAPRVRRSICAAATATIDKLSSLNRPLLDAKARTRIDVSRDTKINAEARLFLSTDYPGSPNLPVGYRQAADLHHLRQHARPDAATSTISN